jgi:signal transduction histidine kinase
MHRSASQVASPSAAAEAGRRPLARRAERQDEMLAAVEVGLWYCDLPFDELQWDRTVKAHFWLPPDARVTIETFYEGLHPDDRERTRSAIDHSIAAHAPYDIEYRTVAPAGSPHAGAVRWLRAIGNTFYDAADRPIRFDGVTVDVTAQKCAAEALRAAEERLREEAQLVETLHRIGAGLAAEFDLDRIVQTVTDESTRLTGAQFGAFFYNVVNEKGEAYTLYTISGVPREHFSKFPMPRNTLVFDPTFKGLGTVRSDDITEDPRYGQNPPHYGMPKGHLPVVSYLAVPVRSHGGEVIGGLFWGHKTPGVFTERHERLVEGIAGWAALAMDNARLFEAQRRARAEAEAARAEAEAANRAKSDFLAAMSHDLRTPLNAIGGYAQLLDLGVHGPVTDAQREALARVRRAQEHLLTLINDILHFARIEAGKLELEIGAVDVESLLGELQTFIEPQAAAKGLVFRCDRGPAGTAVRADRERAAQVLLNLLTNAVKFTEPGGTVRMSWRAEGDVVHLAVADTGRGIAVDRLAAIFDPFVQATSKVSERTEGVGLGLAISRELARAMSGNLSVESEVGVGSTFTLVLPKA